MLQFPLMRFEFADPALDEVYYDRNASLRISPAVDKGFRKVIGKIEAAPNEFVLRQVPGLHYHKLHGNRDHQHALDITDKWRLVVERQEHEGETWLLIISVEDYH